MKKMDLRSLQVVLYSTAGAFCGVFLLLSVCFVRASVDGSDAQCESPTLAGQASAGQASVGQASQVPTGPSSPSLPVAREGEMCVDAICEKGLACEGGFCVVPGKQLPPITCESLDTKRAVAAVIKQCNADPKKDWNRGCSAEDFARRTMDDKTFDLLVRAWREDMFTIVFPPPGTLSKRQKQAAKEQLVKQLESRVASLDQSTAVFVVGRMGTQGDDDKERIETMKRTVFVRDVLKMSSSDSGFGYKTRVVVLNPKRRLIPGQFFDFLAKSTYGFDVATTKKLQSGESSPEADINRSVHVILYPCKDLKPSGE